MQGSDERRFVAEVAACGRKDLTVEVLNEISVPPEPKINITLLQAVANEKALDFILQKGTELGAYKIILFNVANTAAKLFRDQYLKKRERWNKILWEAAKQSDRVHPPKLELADDIQVSLLEYEKIILLDPQGERFCSLVNQFQSWQSYAIVTGPEGGFTPQEVEKFKSLPNCTSVSLGPVLLRAETAALAGLAVLQSMV